MPDVYPFRGVGFSENIKIDDVIAPPYDVIDKNHREKLKSSDEHNIVRIILPDSYEGAKDLMNDWLKNNVLKFDKRCSFYIYTCEYELEGKMGFAKGFLGALKLEEFGKHIKPHEKTLKGPKIDRFNLITRTNAMFCPIMSFYSDENLSINALIDKIIAQKKPDISAKLENAVHKIYAISDTDDILTIKRAMSNKNVIIADGHHRYETALMIQKYYNSKGIKNGGFDYIMTLFMDSNSGGLALLPIHRVVKKIDNFPAFLEKLKKHFNITGGERDADFVMYHNKKFYFLKLNLERTGDILDKTDVRIFEKYVYEDALSLSLEDIKNQKITGYANSEKEVADMVDKHIAEAGFIMHPMGYGELMKIVDSGLTVPQKSTFFYPKIPSGLVAYHFDSMKGCNNV